MSPNSRAAAANAGRSARGETLSSRRRKARPRLEMLEPRLVLSAFTWTGLDSSSPTLWSDANNWLGGVAPTPGSTVIFLPLDSQTIPPSSSGPFAGDSYPTGTTIDIDSADASSITIEDAYTFESDINSPTGGALTLDNNASIVIDPTATLTLQQGLKVNFPGNAAINFSGDSPSSTSLDLLSQQVDYPGTQSGLRPIQIGGNGTMTLGSTTTLLKWNVTVGTGSTAIVPATVFPQIGAVSGSGIVQMQGSPDDGTHLSLNLPPGQAEDFAGTIGGAGGLLSMDAGNSGQGQGAGVQYINNINPDDSGAFVLQVNAGTMLVQRHSRRPAAQRRPGRDVRRPRQDDHHG